jgi:hypothetical protein
MNEFNLTIIFSLLLYLIWYRISHLAHAFFLSFSLRLSWHRLLAFNPHLSPISCHLNSLTITICLGNFLFFHTPEAMIFLAFLMALISLFLLLFLVPTVPLFPIQFILPGSDKTSCYWLGSLVRSQRL